MCLPGGTDFLPARILHERAHRREGKVCGNVCGSVVVVGWAVVREVVLLGARKLGCVVHCLRRLLGDVLIVCCRLVMQSFVRFCLLVGAVERLIYQ